jgi:hypothetical protein
MCAAPGLPGYLFVGQAKGSQGETLKRINLRTNETLPVALTGTLLFQMATTPSSKQLHLLSMESKENQLQTTWFSIPLETTVAASVQLTAISSMTGEDQGADLLPALDGSLVWSSLGGMAISSWNGSTLGHFEPTAHTPRKLLQCNDLLAAINTDGSISLFNNKTGKFLMDLHVTVNGAVFVLTRAQKYILANRYDGAKPASVDPKDQTLLQGILNQPLGSIDPAKTPAVLEGSLPLTLE